MAKILESVPRKDLTPILKPVDYLYIKARPIALVDTKFKRKLLRAEVSEIVLSNGSITDRNGNTSQIDANTVSENFEFLLALPEWVLKKIDVRGIVEFEIFNKGYKNSKDYTGWDLKVIAHTQDTLDEEE